MVLARMGDSPIISVSMPSVFRREGDENCALKVCRKDNGAECLSLTLNKNEVSMLIAGLKDIYDELLACE